MVFRIEVFPLVEYFYLTKVKGYSYSNGNFFVNDVDPFTIVYTFHPSDSHNNKDPKTTILKNNMINTHKI